MKITYNWLKEFIENLENISPAEIAEKLTMSGTEVKKVYYLGENFKNLIIGRILSYEKHPNADKLSLCNVDIGKNLLNIVCGAKNFKDNDIVVVALEGAKIQDFVIKKSKIRGIFSEGMMCSEKELGISDESDGIMILNDSFKIGEDFASQAGLDDWVFELEITPNRPDCLSVAGIAREISALTGLKLKKQDYVSRYIVNKDEKLIIDIRDYDLCPRYSAKIFKSNDYPDTPLWMKNRLMQCDIRSVGLLVDLTNYVMLESGQPLHAFDLNKLYSRKIIIRKAKKEEKLLLIDGSEKILDENDLVIADEKGPVALAGIMGGKDTEINEETKEILLESANFNGVSIMKTSKKMGFRSEASNRFEKKLDPENTINAIGRFEELLCKICNIKSENTFYDNYLNAKRRRSIDLRVKRLNDFLGTGITAEKISEILNLLGFENNMGKEIITVEVPSFRFEDIEREVDLIEEVARIYGFDNIPVQTPRTVAKQGRYTDEQKLVRKIRNILNGMGLNEVINYSFIGKKDLLMFYLDKENDYKDYVKIINPLNEDFEIMRTSLIQSLVRNAKDNIFKKLNNIAIFEISKVFKSVKIDEKKKSIEKNTLGILLSGKSSLKSWDMQEKYFDYFDIKGLAESLLDIFYERNDFLVREHEYCFFHPSISGDIMLKNKKLGVIGKLHPKIINTLDIKQDIYLAEIDLDIFIDNISKEKEFRQISSFPPVNIDMAFIVDEEVKCQDIENEIILSAGRNLQNIRLFDLYRGKQLEDNKKSLAFSLEFNAIDKTLNEKDIELLIKKISGKLSKKFKAILRDQ
ncbi:MAG: phenylalanine--tRNA ligase subunit beta [Actinomycetota bacterium]|nr:phenylalanine--tRNA ligase subunit beta [Actinomycetota bacterium]